MPTELDNGRHYTLALSPGTLLDGTYRVSRVLGHSSTFAVTYLAQDQRSNDAVVVKEFLPRTLAGRAADELTVLPHTPDDATHLTRLLRRFQREAELLADIAHPNIPRVRRHFEANGTAYLVLQHYAGQPLAEHAATAGGRLPSDRAVGLVLQVLQGLEALHAEGIVHGFITPDNVLVDDNSRALILGLGTTRHVVGQAKEPVSGYAPIEQYASREVGPWTDVYACAAVLYRLVTGLTPPSAVERSTGQLVPLAWAPSANVPASLARTVMGALAHLPDARPHSAQEFRRRVEASLALGGQPMSSPLGGMLAPPLATALGTPAAHADRRLSSRWAPPELADAPAMPAPEPEPEAARPKLDEASYLTPPPDGPTDRVRRLLRLVLGGAGAAAAILVVVSAVSGGNDDDWARGAVGAAPASPTVKTSPAKSPTSSETPVASDARATKAATSEPPVRQAAAPLASVAPKRDEPKLDDAPAFRARSEGSSRPTASYTSSSSPTGERASAQRPSAQRTAATQPTGTPAGAPISVALSVPASAGRLEILPVEAVADLRERLAHGKEKAEFGEYASARRIYDAALERITDLGPRYAATQSLAAVKQELEQASARALASCSAENEVIRRRGGKVLSCD